MVQLQVGRGIDPLALQLSVKRVCANLARMELAPDRAQRVVVRAATERAGAMSGGKGSGLVEEEQLGEPTGLAQRRTAPTAEAQPAGDPPSAGEPPPNPAVAVVQAAAISVHRPPCRVRDQLAQRRHPVLMRHGESVP